MPRSRVGYCFANRQPVDVLRALRAPAGGLANWVCPARGVAWPWDGTPKAIDGARTGASAASGHTRACSLGESAGCQRARRLSEPTDERRAGWRDRECELGNADVCRELTVGALVSQPDQAGDEIERLCETAWDSAAFQSTCSAKWSALRADISTFSQACQAGQRGACERLGTALLPYDERAARRALAQECQLRGLSGLFEIPRGCLLDSFAKTKADVCGSYFSRARKHSSLASASGSLPFAETSHLFQQVHLRPPNTALQVAVGTRLRSVGKCLGLPASNVSTALEGAGPLSDQRMNVSLFVDGSGHVLLGNARLDILTDAQRSCVLEVYDRSFAHRGASHTVVVNLVMGSGLERHQ